MALKNSMLAVDVVSTDGNDTKPDETPIFYSLAPGEIDNNCGYKLEGIERSISMNKVIKQLISSE